MGLPLPYPSPGGKARRCLNFMRNHCPQLPNQQNTIHPNENAQSAMQRRMRVYKNANGTTVVLTVLNWHRPCTFRMPKHKLNNAYETARVSAALLSDGLADICVRVKLTSSSSTSLITS